MPALVGMLRPGGARAADFGPVSVAINYGLLHRIGELGYTAFGFLQPKKKSAASFQRVADGISDGSSGGAISGSSGGAICRCAIIRGRSSSGLLLFCRCSHLFDRGTDIAKHVE